MADEEPKESKEKLPAKHVGALSASGTHAVIVAQPAPTGVALPKVSRRSVVVGGFFTALGALAIGGVAGLINFMWPRSAARAAGQFVLDFNAKDLPEGEKRAALILQPNDQNPLENIETKVFIVHLNKEQAERNKLPEKAGAFLALWRKCPHLGCTVPFNATFPFQDPATGQNVVGWFRCPCHGSTYSDSGRKVFGPAPRSMDGFGLTVGADGTITVDLSAAYQGATTLPGNITHAVFQGGESA